MKIGKYTLHNAFPPNGDYCVLSIGDRCYDLSVEILAEITQPVRVGYWFYLNEHLNFPKYRRPTEQEIEQRIDELRAEQKKE